MYDDSFLTGRATFLTVRLQLYRTEKEGVAPADCAEEECDFEEKRQQAGLFHSYMSSRWVVDKCWVFFAFCVPITNQHRPNTKERRR